VASRRYSVVIADRKSGVVRRFTFPLGPTLLTTIVALTLPILIGLGARWSAKTALDDLTMTNARLTVENDNYREATGQLASQVAALQDAVDPAASRAMEKLPAAVRSRAIGGGVTGAVIGSAFGPADTAFAVMRDVLGAIENRLDAVRNDVEKRRSLADATPSIWPVAGWLTSAFGSRRDPFTAGTVVTATNSGNYGNLVVIDHGFGIVTKYGHLSRFGVTSGRQVNRGEVLGYVGSTGRSTSPHLHYEIWVNDKLTNPMRLLGPR
jgi:murein DD-endopeptidase MepM/ murein hydrolase activator NlpD